jgi:signal transduction histidine kinase
VTLAIDGANRELSITNEVAGEVAIDPKRLFEPFYTSKAQGSGLGLAIARKIIEIHGYKISVPQTKPFVVKIGF